MENVKKCHLTPSHACGQWRGIGCANTCPTTLFPTDPMEITCRFFIYPGEKPDNPYEVSCFIEDPGEYTKVYQFASEHLGSTGHPPPGEKRSMVVVDAREDDEALVELLKMVENAGKRPYYGEFFPSDLHQSHFWVRRYRHFDESDFDQARLLRVESWGEEIFTFAGLQDGRFCAKVAGAKWAKRYGTTYCPRSGYFVNDAFRNTLADFELTGAEFSEVAFDKPEKAKGKFFQLISSITMPSCRLPVIPVTASQPPAIEYDDGGIFPKVLKFSESEVEALGAFDVAVTAEKIDGRPDAWDRELIVSQKFRKAMSALKANTVRFVPVELTDRESEPIGESHT